MTDHPRLEVPFDEVEKWEKIEGSCARFYAAAEWGYKKGLATPPPEPQEAMIPDQYKGHQLHVYRAGFHAGYKHGLTRAPAALTQPAPPTDEERLADFTKWLAREMPPNTIIGDPLWWAPPTTAPELPTKEDLMQLAYKYFDFRGNLRGEFFFATSIEAKTDPYQSLTSFAHAVLEQWGK